MQVQAKAKGLKISPRKIGLVAELVRLRSVSDSLVILEHTPKKAAIMLKDVIKSAKANAEHNYKLEADNMIISAIFIGPGPTFKKGRPAAMGRVHPVRKRSSNVTIELDEINKIAKPKNTKAKVAKGSK